MTNLNLLVERANHLVKTQPRESAIPLFADEHTPNCLGSALFAHGISNFDIPDYVPMNFQKYLFNSDLFEKDLRPGSIGYYNFIAEDGNKNFHCFLVLDIYGKNMFNGYQQNGFGKEHEITPLMVDKNTTAHFFFPKEGKEEEIKRAIRERILKNHGMTVELFNEITDASISTLYARLDPMLKFSYEKYMILTSNRGQNPLDMEDYLVASSKAVQASEFTSTKMANETFLYRTFNPEIYLEHGYSKSHSS